MVHMWQQCMNIVKIYVILNPQKYSNVGFSKNWYLRHFTNFDSSFYKMKVFAIKTKVGVV